MPTVVLIAASGATWESTVLAVLDEAPGVVVLKRCVDVDDLLATAASGQAEAAVVALDAPGLDGSAVELLHRHHVVPVAMVGGAADGPGYDAARLRASRIGIARLASVAEVERLPELLVSDDDDVDSPVVAGTPLVPVSAGEKGRIIVVWGPAGAPGRTTVAGGIAAELATRGLETGLVDADPHSPSLAQFWGILDEVSGLLAAARLSGSGLLAERWVSVQRRVAPWLTVVTGLPRPDRYVEVRAGAIQHVLEVAADQGQVVVDTGFSLEDDTGNDYGTRPGRNGLTLGALEVADDVVVVGSADPVGLARLVRGLVELAERFPDGRLHVVVNRMRPTLGWSESELEQTIRGFCSPDSVAFLPEDQTHTDRALIRGQTLHETGAGPLVAALASLVDTVAPDTADDSSRPARFALPRALRRHAPSR